MHALDVIDHLARAGYEIRLSENPGKLRVVPSDAPDELLSMVRSLKADILAFLQGGYPTDVQSGARFMPWCAPIAADQFDRWRLELIEMIEELAELEAWPCTDLDDILSRAINGPVSDLRPNWHYFTGQLQRAREQRDTRVRAAEQAKRFAVGLSSRRT